MEHVPGARRPAHRGLGPRAERRRLAGEALRMGPRHGPQKIRRGKDRAIDRQNLRGGGLRVNPSWVPVLCYHRVCPESEFGKFRSLCVTPGNFRSQMKLLKRLGYVSLSLPTLSAYP